MTTKEAYELGVKLAIKLPSIGNITDWFEKLMIKRVTPWLQKQVEKNLLEMVENVEKNPSKLHILEKLKLI